MTAQIFKFPLGAPALPDSPAANSSAVADDADQELLAQCNAALDLLAHASLATRAGQHVTAARLRRDALTAMRHAAAQRATTPEGVFAKAYLVWGWGIGAQVLARSFASDLIGCRKLQSTLRRHGAGGEAV